MKTEYNPYIFYSLKFLLSYYYNLGNYSGVRELFKISVNGGFEAFSRRATETWELQFKLTTEEIVLEGGKVIPAIEVTGETLDEVAYKALKILRGTNV